MPLEKLTTIRVEKPWGRHRLWPGFVDAAPGAEPVGEIWFDAPGRDPALLVKYLFTSERLSIQVHPDDEAARASGHPRGKDEAWVILAAEPGATIALGTIRPLSAGELRAAALDGSIESLMDWKPAKAGDVIYSPAGTVHALGAGLTLIEVQQNVDLTYRLYDYGRPRELHLDAGIEVADARPFIVPSVADFDETGRACLAATGKFTLERWQWHGTRRLSCPRPGWLIPVAGAAMAGHSRLQAGECWLIEGEEMVALDSGADLLFASDGTFTLA